MDLGRRDLSGDDNLPPLPVVRRVERCHRLGRRHRAVELAVVTHPYQLVIGNPEVHGTALQDPPMVILPNLALMQMENAATAERDKKFRVTGTAKTPPGKSTRGERRREIPERRTRASCDSRVK